MDRKDGFPVKKVAIVYWSGTGNTETMANAVAEGALGAGAEAEVLPVAVFSAGMMEEYDTVAFGCPAMGAEELEDSEFAPVFEACMPKLSGKRIGLFGSYGWGDGEWMRTWEETCRRQGADLARDCVTANYEPDEKALGDCRALGAALAE